MAAQRGVAADGMAARLRRTMGRPDTDPAVGRLASGHPAVDAVVSLSL